MVIRLLIFLGLNFVALAIGGMFTGSGVSSEWYASLNKAPWTPPGWVFGAAWTFLMICFGFYLAWLWPKLENKTLLIGLYSLQWVLNVGWNPVFFYFQNTNLGLLVISALTLLCVFLLVFYWPELKSKSLFILPYVLWLLIATSLNAFISLNN